VSPWLIVVLGLRGAAAIAVVTTFVGGVPRVVQGALSLALGVWSALMVAPIVAPIAGPLTMLPSGVPWELALREVVIGSTLGIVAAVPLLAAMVAGRLVDVAGTSKAHGPYATLFGVLAAAVFVGIDGHVMVVEAIVASHQRVSALVTTQADVVGALAALVPTAVRIAVPWLVTAAVVQVAAGAGVRVAARAAANVPGAIAVPAALVMMTASLVATLAVAMAAVVRHTL
jgi:flagellar biosynthesis protein FliR